MITGDPVNRPPVVILDSAMEEKKRFNPFPAPFIQIYSRPWIQENKIMNKWYWEKGLNFSSRDVVLIESSMEFAV